MDVLRGSGPERVPNQVVGPVPKPGGCGLRHAGVRVAWTCPGCRAPSWSGFAPSLRRHSFGTAARRAGGRARTGATENLGSRRRLGGGTSVSEGSDAVGSVKGVHARGGNHSRDLFGAVITSVAPVRTIVPTPAVLATSSICPGRFRVDGSTSKVLRRVLCRVVPGA